MIIGFQSALSVGLKYMSLQVEICQNQKTKNYDTGWVIIIVVSETCILFLLWWLSQASALYLAL